jgi:hypothetical protein
MKILVLIARLLLGLISVVFGLNNRLSTPCFDQVIASGGALRPVRDKGGETR